MRATLPASLLAAAGLIAAAPAHGEIAQQGNLRVRFGGSIAPQSLPRTGTAPVAVRITSSIETTDGARPPQLRQIRIAINRSGKMFDRGLPGCRRRRIHFASMAVARRACGAALVGHGRVGVVVNLPTQRPFLLRGRVLAFKSRVGGSSGILTQVYARRPPSSLLMPLSIDRDGGVFGTALTVRLPRAARRWAYLQSFDLTLRRTYSYRGARRSYISAGCAAPAGFPGALFPFARATFSFAGGRRLGATLVRSCTVRG